MAETKSVLNLCLDDAIDMDEIKERRLYINEGIDETIIGTIVFYIMKFNREDKGKPVKDRKPIILYMNSPGGSVSDGYGVIDAISTSKTPVITVNQAMCASMGFLIFLAGHKRYSMPHAEFLMHDGSTSGWDSTAKMKDRIDFETGQLEEMTKNYILSRTKITPKKYDEKYRVEWYMLPEEAKKYGICDFIVSKDCDIEDIL